MATTPRQAIPTTSSFVRSSHSFSGVDISGMFGGVRIASLQALSYAITREKAPVYTLGSADPRSFSRGKRAIAGSMVFIMFDRHPLISHMKELSFVAKREEVRNDSREFNPDGLAAQGRLTDQDAAVSVADAVAIAPFYVDQIPPFDISVLAVNEYGATANMSIHNVEITDEGHGFSVDDLQLGFQAKWIGRYVVPWSFNADSIFPGPPIARANAATDKIATG